MKFKIMAEAHEGVFSIDEECLDVMDADSEIDALTIFADKDARVTNHEGVFWIKHRRIFAVS